MFENVELIDLTHILSSQVPTWNGSCGFHLETKQDYDQMFRVQQIKMHAGVGTHMDAPSHCILGGKSIHEIPIEQLIGPACVIDVSAQVRASADFLLTQPLVEEWERKHGRIPSRAWVLIRTDWSKRSGEGFLNISADGPHTPGFHVDCVPFLARERDILGVGVETVGTDAGQAATFNPMFPCHTIMHGANRFGLASLTNLDQLPPTGAVVIAPPLKIVNGSGSPLRVLALVPA